MAEAPNWEWYWMGITLAGTSELRRAIATGKARCGGYTPVRERTEQEAAELRRAIVAAATEQNPDLSYAWINR